MQVKKLSVSFSSLVSAVGLASFVSVTESVAETVEAKAGEFVEIRVPAAESRTSDSLVVGDGAKVFKTGGGTWSVSTRGVSQINPAEVGVLKGTAVLTAEGMAPAPAIPSFVTERALAWIDVSAYASHPELFTVVAVNGTNFVEACHDVRETNLTAPTRPRLTGPGGVLSPELATLDGKSVLWFGGYQSGRYANWIDASGNGYLSGKEAFFVHRAEDSFGFIGDLSMPVANHWLKSGGCYGSATWQTTANFTVQRQDGVSFDGTCTAMPKGTHVLNVAGSLYLPKIFSDSSGIGKKGGDYVCEVIVFSEELSEQERLQLTAYLGAKWNVGTTSLAYAVREGAHVTVNATADGDRVSVSGRGTVVKTGAGKPVIDVNGAFGGTFTTDAVGVDMRGAVAVSPVAGTTVTSGASGGIGLSVATDAAADTWRKAGAGAAYIRDVPESVGQISVSEGTLTVWPTAKDALSGEADVEVEIPNAGFEEWSAAELEAGTFEVGLNPNAAVHGWYGDSSSNPSIFDYSRWPADTKGPITGNTREAYGLTVSPPQGNCAIFITHAYYSGGASVWTFVDIPASGIYSFSCRVGGRNNNYGYLGTPVDVYLVPEGEAVSATHRLGKMRYLCLNAYAKIVLTGKVSAAGRYKLLLNASSPNDRGVCYDDLHLWRRPDLADDSAVVRVPGGDFEDAYFDSANSYVREFNDANTNAGWTIIQPAGTTATSIGYSTPAVALTDSYAGGRESEGGFAQLCFYHESKYTRLANGGSVETTFTPPAGRWRVRAALARLGGASTLTASAAVGENAAVTLGANARTNQRFETWRWPTVFETDGQSAVKLSFAFSTQADSARLYADDFELEPADAVQTDVEFIENGDFEFMTYEGSTVPRGFSSLPGIVGNYLCRDYGFVPSAFGTDRVSGKKYLCLGNDNGLTQQVTLPAPGTYCLSYYAHRRIDNDYKNILRAWIVGPDGVSREIGRTRYENEAFTRTVYCFTVPAAGSYTVGLAGLLSTGAWSPAYETLIDGLSLRAVETVAGTAPLHTNLTVSVASGARLNLNYAGTNQIARLRLGGHAVFGIVDAASHPDYIAGQGALDVPRRGMTLILR